jgi:hypothetical protein
VPGLANEPGDAMAEILVQLQLQRGVSTGSST